MSLVLSHDNYHTITNGTGIEVLTVISNLHPIGGSPDELSNLSIYENEMRRCARGSAALDPSLAFPCAPQNERHVCIGEGGN